MKIGLLGGSFDPVHYGHLHMARQARQEYGLDEVWLIPAGHSPNKDERHMTPAAARLAMCRLAVMGEEGMDVCPLEVESEERSYTYRTLQKLTGQYPQHQFYFIMGADSLDYLEQWCHPEIIAQLSTILVVNRNQFSEDDLQEKIRLLNGLFPLDVQIVHCDKWNISSSEIRKALSQGRDIDDYVPQNVIFYIKENQLYR